MNNSALEILENTISEYNKNTSDLNKFAFSAREKEIFVSMMKKYASECSKASLEEAADNAIWSVYQNDDGQEPFHHERNIFIQRNTITNEDNIVLL